MGPQPNLPVRPLPLSLFVSISIQNPLNLLSASPLLILLISLSPPPIPQPYPTPPPPRRRPHHGLLSLLLSRRGTRSRRRRWPPRSARAGEPDRGRVPGRRDEWFFFSFDFPLLLLPFFLWFFCAVLIGSELRVYGDLFDWVLGACFSAEVEASGTLDGDRGNGGSVDEELMREANYLKSCGAIGETPPEMLKGSHKITEEETDGELKRTAVSENLSEGFHCDEHSALKPEHYIDEGTDNLPEAESVLQSCLQDKSSHQNIRNQRLDSSDSPHPTPLVLRGDMQTPGTLNTAYKEALRSGKRARTNKQFIYPVLRPIENKLQWMELRDDSSPVLSSNPPKRRYLSTDSSKKPQETVTNAMATQTEKITSSFSFHDITAGQDQGVISPEEPKSENDSIKLLDDADQLKYNADSARKGVASLSCWLKPPSSAGGSRSDTEGKVAKQRCYENSVFTDLPIFTASGLNWDNDKPTPVLPKVWDGNGIPNTTTKYKEDQKVSWHATPFEERLLKVLSDEKPHHQRKISGKLIQLDEETN